MRQHCNQYRLLEKIKRLCQEKGTRVVASMHDPNLTARYADTVTMLSQGRVLASGPTDTVMTARMVGRLYQTPTRRVDVDDGTALFVPCAPGQGMDDGKPDTAPGVHWT